MIRQIMRMRALAMMGGQSSGIITPMQPYNKDSIYSAVKIADSTNVKINPDYTVYVIEALDDEEVISFDLSDLIVEDRLVTWETIIKISSNTELEILGKWDWLEMPNLSVEGEENLLFISWRYGIVDGLEIKQAHMYHKEDISEYLTIKFENEYPESFSINYTPVDNGLGTAQYDSGNGWEDYDGSINMHSTSVKLKGDWRDEELSYRSMLDNQDNSLGLDDFIFSLENSFPKTEIVEYMFSETFFSCSSLTAIPDDLFKNITGKPLEYMFYNTFNGCSLTAIPDDLFKNISGEPVEGMFSGTFVECSLTSIPNDLFKNISGEPADWVFNCTFAGCSSLTSIPNDLFKNISGEPVKGIFSETFYNCSSLTAIPDDLFKNISGEPVEYMFFWTFYGLINLEMQESPKNNGIFLYDQYPTATYDHVGGCFAEGTAERFTDNNLIPEHWKTENV